MTQPSASAASVPGSAGPAVEILGAESLGVRSLCCVVRAGDRRIVIDPGVALGYLRHGLQPHPCELAFAARVRSRIVAALEQATDVVFSHMHGDHVPLRRARPYQLSFRQLPPSFLRLPCWSKAGEGLSRRMQLRLADLQELLGPQLRLAEGRLDGPLSFSPALPHGYPDRRLGTVMMTRVELESGVFVHASDIQLLDGAAVEQILAWRPHTVLAAGPPLYLAALGGLTEGQIGQARENARRLARQVDQLILDHHLLRSGEGFAWLDALSEEAGRKVCCVADYLGRPRLPLEALRGRLYELMPVPAGWYEEYARGNREPQDWCDESLLAWLGRGF